MCIHVRLTGSLKNLYQRQSSYIYKLGSILDNIVFVLMVNFLVLET